MLKTIIVDDEIESIRALTIKLEKCSVAIKICAYTCDPTEVGTLLRNHAPDILFLDIEMPGLSGIELLESLQERSFEVVIVTAHADYALQALKANAIDYLLKPVDVQELQQALEKISSRKQKGIQKDKIIKHLTSLFEQTQPQNNIISLSSSSETHYVDTQNIIYVSGDNNYSTFHLCDGRKVVVSKTLKEFEEKLTEKSFFRVHRSHLVNLNHIKKLNKGLDLSLIMTNGAIISVAFRKKAYFLKLMKGYYNL